VYWLIKLKFAKGFNFNSGEETEGEDFRGIIHSDMLFSALVNQMVLMPLPVERNAFVNQLVNQLNTTPPFKISSAFPFFRMKYYLPVPIGTSGIYRNTLKDIRFIDDDNFGDLAEGRWERIRKNVQRDEVNEILFNFNLPRVTVDRITAATNFYSTSGWTVLDGGGFYFFIELFDDSYADILKTALGLLSENGLGGDRSSGYGRFEHEIITIEKHPVWCNLFHSRNHTQKVYYSLSLCSPADNIEKQSARSYQIIPRRGWLLSNSSLIQMKRRECKMFAEGSLFSTPVNGKVETVTPSEFMAEHPVYRYGLAMTLEIANTEVKQEITDEKSC
jgi:CRISPR-associated protein Csm4